jgi:hypothetical protein
MAIGESAAQSLSDLHSGTWGGSLEADFGVERDRTQSPNGTADIESRIRHSREALTIRNDGFFFVDPLVATGTLALTFGLTQDRQTAGGTEFDSHAKLIGYALDTSILTILPYNGSLFANRTEDRTFAPSAAFRADYARPLSIAQLCAADRNRAAIGIARGVLRTCGEISFQYKILAK